MEQSKHTPGPWRFAGNYSIIGAMQETSPAGHRAGVPNHPLVATVAERSERLANARLIAAAPDMLAFVRELMEECVEDAGSDDPKFHAPSLGLLSRANALIAKAEGRTE